MFERDITSAHLWPESIISNGDKLFVSKFWQGLMKRMGVKSEATGQGCEDRKSSANERVDLKRQPPSLGPTSQSRTQQPPLRKLDRLL